MMKSFPDDFISLEITDRTKLLVNYNIVKLVLLRLLYSVISVKTILEKLVREHLKV